MDILERNKAKYAATARRLMADSLERRADELVRTAQRWRKRFAGTADDEDLEDGCQALTLAAMALRDRSSRLRDAP